MQKKESIKPASGSSDKVFEIMPSRCWKTPFLECRIKLRASKVIPKLYIVIYYIVLYSIIIVFGIISSSRYWKM